jgi:glycosyltransferase involved in cell wall biosynthesis
MTFFQNPSDLYSWDDGGAAAGECISVVATRLNDEGGIIEILDAIHAQSYPIIELIVVDDNSGDGSADLALNWMKEKHARFTRCVLTANPHSRGPAVTRNTGIELSRSDWIFILGADHLPYPHALSRLRSAIEGRVYGAAYAQVERFGAIQGLGDADVWSKSALGKENYIGPTALMKREALARVGGYTHMEGGWEDYDLWCKFIELEIEALFVPELLFRQRTYASSALATQTPAGDQALRTQMLLRHAWLDL